MSNFDQLIEDLSSEDRETEAVSDRTRIMEAVTGYVGTLHSDVPRAALLWLVDRNSKFKTQDCTLSSFHVQDWPVEVTERQLFNITRRYRKMPPAEAISQAQRDVSIKSEALFKKTGLFGAARGDWADDMAEHVIPLEPSDERDRERRFVGYLQIIAPKITLRKIQKTQCKIIGKLVFNRISFGRRQRMLDALNNFQKEIVPGLDEDRGISAALASLEKYLTLERICVYDHAATNGARKKHQRGANRLELPELSEWIERYFKATAGDSPTEEALRVADLFTQSAENPILEASIQDGVVPDAPSGVDRPVAVMLIPIHAGEPQGPPLATIKLIVAALPGFIGGTFSETDEQIGNLLSNYLSDLLPGVITQSRAQKIAEQLSDHDSAPLLQATAQVKAYDAFPDLITEVLPTVAQAWAFIRTTDDSNESITQWISNNGDVEHNPLSLSEEALENSQDYSSQPLDDGRHLHCVKVLDSDEKLRLYWISGQAHVPQHDLLIVRLIASDMRLRAFGKLDVRELTRQITELRHAVKASMTGVTGFTDLIAGYFDDARELEPAERDDEIFGKARFRNWINDLKLSTDTTMRFFDGVRLLKLNLARDDVRTAQTSPNELAARIVRMMKPFTVRRGLQVEIRRRYPDELPDPYFDPNLMHIAFANLIENAIKYARRDTKIFIEIGVERNSWYFFVLDEGRYIPPEDRERIFTGVRLDPFSGETAQAGTGMGLPAVRRIVKAHDPHGSDEVSSSLTGGGSSNAPTANTRIGFRLRRTPPSWN